VAPGVARAEGMGPDALDILVVDDNEDAAQTLALFLGAHGHQVRVAYRAAEALNMAAERAPQVLLLDIGLPDVDGHELARRLRSFNTTQDSIYVALTGYGRPEDRASSQEAGFDFHLTKPVDPADLAELIGSLVARPHPALCRQRAPN
jgi:CheY-like chemotaxis protein